MHFVIRTYLLVRAYGSGSVNKTSSVEFPLTDTVRKSSPARLCCGQPHPAQLLPVLIVGHDGRGLVGVECRVGAICFIKECD